MTKCFVEFSIAGIENTSNFFLSRAWFTRAGYVRLHSLHLRLVLQEVFHVPHFLSFYKLFFFFFFLLAFSLISLFLNFSLLSFFFSITLLYCLFFLLVRFLSCFLSCFISLSFFLSFFFFSFLSSLSSFVLFRFFPAVPPPSRYPPVEKPKNPSWGPLNLSSRRYGHSKTRSGRILLWQIF